MMNWVVIVFLVLCSTGLALAEKPEQPDPARMVAQLSEQLELTEEQQPRVQAIIEEGTRERRALMDEYGRDFRSARPQLQALRESQRSKLAEILSDVQLARYDALMDAKREQMRGNRKRPFRLQN